VAHLERQKRVGAQDIDELGGRFQLIGPQRSFDWTTHCGLGDHAEDGVVLIEVGSHSGKGVGGHQIVSIEKEDPVEAVGQGVVDAVVAPLGAAMLPVQIRQGEGSHCGKGAGIVAEGGFDRRKSLGSQYFVTWADGRDDHTAQRLAGGVLNIFPGF